MSVQDQAPREDLELAEVFPVESYLLEEIKSRGWSHKEFADKLGYSPQFVSDVLRGRRAISYPLAARLAVVFGTSAEVWLRLDLTYRLDQFLKSDEGKAISERHPSRSAA